MPRGYALTEKRKLKRASEHCLVSFLRSETGRLVKRAKRGKDVDINTYKVERKSGFT
ncbi:hypothetical protein X777_02203 [Ooceraea biroi]|uniref:Uncharacterized protein n=1 Tax=Ooceraea biroi TaxID=2015173 RepID=A0A026VSP3_OOCBI|nr:hypothetical protein X777_02203 [Ooceraea biroi]